MLFLRLGKLSLGIPGECGTRQEQRRARIRGAAHKRRFDWHPRIAQGCAIAMHGIVPLQRALSAPLPSHPSRALPPRASLPAAFRCPAHLTQVYRAPANDRNQRRNRLLPRPVSPPERQKPNVGRREERQKGDAAGNPSRSSLAGRMGRKKWGARKGEAELLQRS